jgi:two-component system, response regulator
MTGKSVVEILLVEDNPSDVEITLYALKKGKITNHVHVARDGEEALDFIFCMGNYKERDISHIPKLIILDLQLPKISGIEILRKVRANERTLGIPVIVLTNSRNNYDILETTRLRIDSYILKPFDVDQFVESVRQIGFYWILFNQNPQRN